MTATKSRYRPAFSKEEVDILHIILMDRYLSETSSSHKPKVFSGEEVMIYNQLIGKINTLRTKIANNVLNPAYVVRKHIDPALAILEDLGADEAELDSLAGGETKEQYWTRCFDKYSRDPSSCTVAEIEAAMEYMYLNDMMSPIQIAMHERKI